MEINEKPVTNSAPARKHFAFFATQGSLNDYFGRGRLEGFEMFEIAFAGRCWILWSYRHALTDINGSTIL